MRSIASVPALVLPLVLACGPSTNPGDGDGSAGSTSDASSGPATDPGGTSLATSTSSTSGATQAVDSSGPSATTGEDDGLPPGCRCIEPPADATTCDALARSECELETLCDELVGECQRLGPDMYTCNRGSYTWTEQALTCMLEALRDRTPGRLTYAVQNEVCFLEGCAYRIGQISIVGDGLALVQDCEELAIGATASYDTLDTLAEPAYFEGCLALTPPAERYECMRGGIENGAVVCE